MPSSSLVRFARQFLNEHWPGWLNLLIWLFGSILLVGMTTLDFLPLLEDYRFKNVATNIGVIKNQSGRPQNMTICLPYYFGSLSAVVKSYRSNRTDRCLECEALTTRGYDVWTTATDFDLQNETIRPENLLANALINRFFQKRGPIDDQEFDDSDLILQRSNFNWNQPLVDAFWTLFSCYYRMDVWYTTNETASLNCNGFDYALLDHAPDRVIDRLYDTIVGNLDVYLRIDVSSEKNKRMQSPSVELRRRSPPPVLYSDQFCFPLLADSTVERFEYRAIPSNMDDIDPPWMRYVRTGELEIYETPDRMYAYVHSYESLYQTVKASTNDLNFEKISLIYNLETRVVEARPNRNCSNELSPAVCFMRKQIAEVAEHCRCIPFTFRRLSIDNSNNRSLINISSYCTLKAYKNCSQYLTPYLDRFDRECSDTCEYIFYRWKQFEYTRWDEESKNWRFTVQLVPANMPYIEFRLDVKDSWEKFLSQIGGLVNFYLGFSGLSMVYVLTNCIDWAKRWNRWRKKKTTSSITSSSSLWSIEPIVLEAATRLSGFKTVFEEEKELELIRAMIRRELREELRLEKEREEYKRL